jgi:hypothetical protein
MPKWFPSWMDNEDDKDKDKKKKVELPPELEEVVKKVSETDSKITAMDERLKGLDSITAFIEEQKKEKEEAAKKAKAPKVKTPDEESEEAATLAARLLEDPKGVISEITGAHTQGILQIRADNIRRQVFDDRSSEFEYYNGDIKKEVDALISSQNLTFQNDPKALENCYHTVVGRKMKEISEGKIKSRFASSTGNISTNKESKEDMTFETTPEMIKAAKLSGMELEDYKALVKKAALAGEIEYV